MALRNEPIVIAWGSISELLVIHHPIDPQYQVFFEFADGLKSSLRFYSSEVVNFSEFDSFLNVHPIKAHQKSFSNFKANIITQLKYKYKYAPVTEAYFLGILALTFMFFQIRYFGSILIQKYQFLIKSSCNQQCADFLWSGSVLWFWFIAFSLCPLVLILFYKKVYKSIARSKSVSAINGTLTEMTVLTLVGIIMLATSIPTIYSNQKKYSKILGSYIDGTLQSKLSQKVEMASKRKFEGDTEENPDLEISREE
ncbi:hypothetical protein CIK05_04895 [Bdellovibrio sp. qaytius]|nr:hypothetical protein CIK05_04895 [Bdellovibrio sp. qaytius]